jgi:hypothetical protein
MIAITIDGDLISAITRFHDTGVMPAFGLPRTLSDCHGARPR